jgi:high-affinity iron transporter
MKLKYNINLDMKLFISLLTTLFFLLFVSGYSQTVSYSKKKELRRLVTLLDYVAKDYSGAVQNGKVINDTEYLEIIELTETCKSLYLKLRDKIKLTPFTVLESDLKELSDLIKKKADKDIIAKQAKDIKNKILAIGLLKISPLNWPSLNSGMTLYSNNCITCHGSNGMGDGTLAVGLNPKPSNFQDSELMSNLSPLQIYNVVKLGLPRTAMRSFNEFSERELWDISFYIMSLRYKNQEKLEQLPPFIVLDSISRWTDSYLKNYLEQQFQTITVAQVRLFEPIVKKPLDIAKDNLLLSLNAYINKNKDEAQKLALTAYLEGVELVEPLIRANDPKLLVHIEKTMINYRASLKGDNEQLVKNLNLVAKQQIEKAEQLLSQRTYSFSFTYGTALSILLREAIEALLILLVMIRILKSLNFKKAITYIHIGWIVALVLGVASWFFVDALIQMSGSSRELMEGFGSLIAVIILIYMGTWLHSKSEVKKWKEFIEVKINNISKSGNWFLLIFFSFIVVFREVFEVILFLETLKLDAATQNNVAIGWAVITASILITLFAILILRFSKKIPLRQIFIFSAYTMAILTIVLTGKGVRAIQESGLIGSTLINDGFRFEMLGLYPSLETLLSQFGVLIIIAGLWYYKKANKIVF